MVHDPIRAHRKLPSGENPVLNLPYQVFNNPGSDLGIAKSNGCFATHRMGGRFQPLASGFFRTKKLESFSKYSRKPRNAVAFILVEMPCFFATVECCS